MFSNALEAAGFMYSNKRMHHAGPDKKPQELGMVVLRMCHAFCLTWFFINTMVSGAIVLGTFFPSVDRIKTNLPAETRWTTLRATIINPVTISDVSKTAVSVAETAIPTISVASTASQVQNSDSATTNFQDEILDVHNFLRQKHNSPPLQWSAKLQNYAQNYADQYNCNGILKHSGAPYGENIALGFNTTAALYAWYDEIKVYNFDNPGFSEQTGHFTQLVWKNTSQVGCGKIYCGSYYGQYTICNYYSPGNVAGQYRQNVS
ncbi:LAMI_0H14488g1_1 [Lachancea mirantina]|uniref:LAMI_0H14488g1_1 n=1 Tax=Lachancea mirantina TaxID=1230905 RepID=A0A1G4KIB2_9SACH|nr:LAMI_0H14488g1_1 [Lachancea mirantina]